MNHPKSLILLLLFILLITGSCEKKETPPAPPVEEPFFVIGDTSDLFYYHTFDPPITLKPGISSNGNPESDVSRSLLDADGVGRVDIWATNESDEKENEYQYTRSFIYVNCFDCYIIHEEFSDTVYTRQRFQMDSVIRFNYKSGLYRELISNDSGRPYKTAYTNHFPKPFSLGDTIFYEKIGVNWRGTGIINDEANNFLYFKSHTIQPMGTIYTNDSTTKRAPIADYRFNKLWADQGRKFLVLKSKELGASKFKYGWMEFKVFSTNEIRIHSLVMEK